MIWIFYDLRGSKVASDGTILRIGKVGNKQTDIMQSTGKD